MTELKYGSKKATALAKNYWDSPFKNLNDCYARPSKAKENAYFWCKYQMVKCNGYDLRICSYNAQIFTAAFRFKENDIEYLAYITPYYNYKIRLS